MSLKDRLSSNITQTITEDSSEDLNFGEDKFLTLKEGLYLLLMDKVNSTPIWANYDEDQQKELITQFIENQLSTNFKTALLTKEEKNALIGEIIEETKGYGPLDSLLQDPVISSIFINDMTVYAEKNGKIYKTDVTFKNEKHLKTIMENMLAKANKKIDANSPIVDAKLPNGFRINAVIEPLALNGPFLSIKKTNQEEVSLENLLTGNILTDELLETLSMAVKAKLNIVISGKKCSGKTLLLNALASEIPEEERIITIEDSAELALPQEHVLKFETQSSIGLKGLFVNALKMRPDRIIIGECKGAEILEVFQAINTGCEGFLTTLYANSPQDALSKLEIMLMLAGTDLSEQAIKSLIASNIDLIVHVSRFQDGSTRISSVTEITGMQGNKISTQEIFRFEQTGLESSKFLGCHISTGIKPEFIAKLKEKNLSIPLEYFNKERKHNCSKGAEAAKPASGASGIRNRIMRNNNNLLSQRLRK